MPRSDLHTEPSRSPRTVSSEPLDSSALHAPAGALWRGIRALVRRFSISERAEVSCCGMTVAQAAALQALGVEPLAMGELARRLGISPSTATRNLKRLEGEGLVGRYPDPDDARVSRVCLTAAGKEAVRDLEDQEVAFARSILEEIRPERRVEVLAAVEELLGAVRRATESCCPGAFDHLMEATCRQPMDTEPAEEGSKP